MEGGTLYGGNDTNNRVDTIDPATGAATAGPTPTSNLGGSFFGLAPFPVPASAPEPGTWGLFAGSLATLALLRRR